MKLSLVSTVLSGSTEDRVSSSTLSAKRDCHIDLVIWDAAHKIWGNKM